MDTDDGGMVSSSAGTISHQGLEKFIGRGIAIEEEVSTTELELEGGVGGEESQLAMVSIANL